MYILNFDIISLIFLFGFGLGIWTVAGNMGCLGFPIFISFGLCLQLAYLIFLTVIGQLRIYQQIRNLHQN